MRSASSFIVIKVVSSDGRVRGKGRGGAACVIYSVREIRSDRFKHSTAVDQGRITHIVFFLFVDLFAVRQ